MRYLRDKKIMLPVAAVAGVFLCIVLLVIAATLSRQREAMRAQRNEMRLLKDEYLSLKGMVAAVEGRRAAAKVEGVIPAVDEIFKSLGLSQRVKSVKLAGTRDQRYASEEEAEVQLEKVSMNELVNILYKIENAPMILTIKKTGIRTSFENPTLFSVAMTIDFIRPK